MLLAVHNEPTPMDPELSFVQLRKGALRIPLIKRIGLYRKDIGIPARPLPPRLDDGREHTFVVRARH